MNRCHSLMGPPAAGAASRIRVAASLNDAVWVTCVGVSGRGRTHIARCSEMGNVEIAAICDIGESVLDERIGELEKSGRRRPPAYTDLRKLLEDKNSDAILIASPHHRHALQTIWTCQTGKHVHVEKPCSHDRFEARQIVAAAKKYNGLVQHGTDSRSSMARGAIRQVRGLVRDVYVAHGLCIKRRKGTGHAPVEPVPPGHPLRPLAGSKTLRRPR